MFPIVHLYKAMWTTAQIIHIQPTFLINSKNTNIFSQMSHLLFLCSIFYNNIIIPNDLMGKCHNKNIPIAINWQKYRFNGFYWFLKKLRMNFS